MAGKKVFIGNGYGIREGTGHEIGQNTLYKIVK